MLAAAHCPPTPLGARADLERLHMCRAARRAAEAGPRFPQGHWVVLRLLGFFCVVDVAVVAALTAASSTTADGSLAGSVLVGISGTALLLSESIVADVADRGAGMYTVRRRRGGPRSGDVWGRVGKKGGAGCARNLRASEVHVGSATLVFGLSKKGPFTEPSKRVSVEN